MVSKIQLLLRLVLLNSRLGFSSSLPHITTSLRDVESVPQLGTSDSNKTLSTVVDLGYARYQGITLPAGVNQWLGIRFAAPPLEDLRWRAPVDPPTNGTLQSATEFAPTCLGLFGPGLSNSTNEDCLFLDVFAPSSARLGSNLPVWFFIQGGGYAGDTDENFNFTEVISKGLSFSDGFVGVQINYRVGAFGFLASEEVRADGDLNVGLLDQQKQFGVDKDHVVIHGDSAGAGSVSFQLTAYGGRNDRLFIGGMMESPFWPTHRKVSQMQFQYNRFAAALNCSNSEYNSANSLACLRSKTTSELQVADVAGTFPSASGTAEWWFLPVIDGTFSIDYLYNQFEQGKVVRVPVVVGDDTNEGTGFAANASSSAEFLAFIKDNYPHFTITDLAEINGTYPKNGFETFPHHADYFPATEAAYGESTFICPGIEISRSLAQYNSPEQVWNYRYNVKDHTLVRQGYGVPHVSEKPAIWGPGNSGPCGIPCTYETYNAPIVPLLMSYWVSFIVSLNPNTHRETSAPVWETWNSAEHKLQRLRIQLNDTAMEYIPEQQQGRCNVWKALATTSQQ